MDTTKMWDYRVVRKESDDGSDEWYSVQEVYYDDETGEPMAQSIDLQIEGDNITGMRTQLERMIECLDKPILDENDITDVSGVKVNPNDTDGLEVGPWEGMIDTDEKNKTYID